MKWGNLYSRGRRINILVFSLNPPGGVTEVREEQEDVERGNIGREEQIPTIEERNNREEGTTEERNNRGEEQQRGGTTD